MEATPDSLAKKFYKLDCRGGTFREYGRGNPWPLVPFAWLIKLLRVPIPCSVDDPHVEALQPFEVAEEALPEEIRTRFHPIAGELGALGFHRPIFHAFVDPQTATWIYQASYLHPSGQSCARIHYRRWTQPHPPREYLYPMFVSELAGGRFLISTAGKLDVDSPPQHVVNRATGAGATALWNSHQAALAKAVAQDAANLVTTQEGLRDMLERMHTLARDFHLRRKFFVPRSVQEEAEAARQNADLNETARGGGQHPEVTLELDKLQASKPGWGGALILLAVSALVFVGSGFARDGFARGSWQFALALVPVLLFHELGHYLTMQICGYKNLRMFFIPFFGAAVTGKNYNVAGWKKALVSLMGPLPGIILGIVIGVGGLILKQDWMVQAALLMQILNGFNLLPVLPLDGGWILHSVLFCRHPLMDAAFRVLAIAALLALGAWSGDRVLVFICIFMAVGLPIAFKQASIASRLRKQGLDAASADAQTIPPETADVIITEVKAAFPKGQNSKLIAQHTLGIFEILNARPPGWAASIALLFTHATGLLLALVFAVVFTLGAKGRLPGLDGSFEPDKPLKSKITQLDLPVWAGAEAKVRESGAENTLVATFPSETLARQTFAEITNRLPATAELRVFGQSLLLLLPAEDAKARKDWLADLERRKGKPVVDSTNFVVRLALSCTSPDVTTARAVAGDWNDTHEDGASFHLSPPWVAATNISPETLARERLARHTYRLMSEAESKASAKAYSSDFGKRIQAARKVGDQDEIKRLEDERDRNYQDALQKARDELLAKEGARVDAELLRIKAQLPRQRTPATSNEFARVNQELAARLGQLPMADGKPVRLTAREAVRYGSVTDKGTSLRFHWVSFERLIDGAPAAVNWLKSRGCTDFAYEFESGHALEEDD